MTIGQRLRKIAEEEVVLVVLLGGFAVFFLMAVPPILIVNDTWMTLAAGREVVEHGLPSTETLTILGIDRTWTNQQWGAQLIFYGAHALGGFPLMAIVTCAAVTMALGFAAACARQLGADPRAVAILLFPTILAAPWAWTIRAQVLALPFFTGLLWLLATQSRRPTRLVYLAFPILVVWANVHGSVAIGALFVMTLGAIELVRSRGRSGLRSILLVVLAPLAVLATPYGPVATARYYHLLLVDPPFGDDVTEWTRTDPDWNTMFFYALVVASALIVARGWRRLSAFDFAVLGVTLVNAQLAIRGIVWFSLAAFELLPAALIRKRELRLTDGVRKINRVLAVGTVAVVAAAVVFALVRDAGWYVKRWPDDVVATLRPAIDGTEATVYATSAHADWLLWHIPELRGRLAYDVRFEIYTPETFDRINDFDGMRGEDWKSISDGYEIVVLPTGRDPSPIPVFRSEPGVRVIYRDDRLVVVSRPV